MLDIQHRLSELVISHLSSRLAEKEVTAFNTNEFMEKDVPVYITVLTTSFLSSTLSLSVILKNVSHVLKSDELSIDIYHSDVS